MCKYCEKTCGDSNGGSACQGQDLHCQENDEVLQLDWDQHQRQCALDALEDMAKWFSEQDGEVALFDATNTTRERRKTILEFCCPCDNSAAAHSRQYSVFFIESVCTDKCTVYQNIKDVKVTGPDYDGVDTEVAAQDFVKRISHYQSSYEPLCEEHDRNLSFIKIYDQGEKFLVNKIRGHIQSRAAYYLMNIHTAPRTIYLTRVSIVRTIYLTRHGESVYNVLGRIGGDADLSIQGEEYAHRLANYIEKENIEDLTVWTSELKRTKQTASISKLLLLTGRRSTRSTL
ncbi:PFKFB2 [Bugula neritina]|uniref:PFKFB2 n=1 Tax=Bugula neritina TaxID=10212 RepID=A0A7J7JF07_BUGNE|nr:PFKFB2 [Bugula neritina]